MEPGETPERPMRGMANTTPLMTSGAGDGIGAGGAATTGVEGVLSDAARLVLATADFGRTLFLAGSAAGAG
jgi:hypothetical protein